MTPRVKRWTLLGLLPLLPVLGASAGLAKQNAQPRTLVTVRGAIYAFAQDGDTLGWIGADARARIRRVSIGKTWIVGKVDPPERATGAVIAVAGTRALWAWDSGGNSSETAIMSGAPGRPAAVVAGLMG